MTGELHGLRPSGHPTPATSAYPHPLTGGVRVLTVFPPPPRGENGEGPWSSTETPHPLRDLTTHLGRADTTGAESCATEDGSDPRRRQDDVCVVREGPVLLERPP